MSIKNCAILTPCYEGKLATEYVNSLVETIYHGQKLGINISFTFLPGESLIQKARNELLKLANSMKDLDCILFIDADMFWDPLDAIRLMNHEEDIVGGVARRRDPFTESFNVRINNGQINMTKSGLIEVDSVGTGFLKMSKKAISDLINSSPTYSFNNIKEDQIASVFEIQIKDGELYSEDYIMCHKWKELGNKVYVDPSANIGHISKINIKGDFLTYLTRALSSEN